MLAIPQHSEVHLCLSSIAGRASLGVPGEVLTVIGLAVALTLIWITLGESVRLWPPEQTPAADRLSQLRASFARSRSARLRLASKP
jgi:hypothetical protein